MIVAVRPLLIDKQYEVGDVIPVEVIHKNRISVLKGCGLIKEVEDEMPVIEQPVDIEQTTEIKKIYSERKLSKLSKEKLTEIASKENIDTDGLTKAELISVLTES